jgi:hypothetical protein
MAIRVSQPALTSVSIGPTVLMDWQATTFNASVLLVFSNTPVATASVEYTLDKLGTTDEIAAAVWQPFSQLTGRTATSEGNLYFPVVAVRLNVTSYTSGNVQMKVLQGDSV